MKSLKPWLYNWCEITVHNSSQNADVLYDGFIVAASDTVVHLTDVQDVTYFLRWKQKALGGTYIFDYSGIKSAVVYRMVKDPDTDAMMKQIIFSCYQ